MPDFRAKLGIVMGYEEHKLHEYPGLKSWGGATALSGPGASCDASRSEVLLNKRYASSVKRLAFCVKH